MEPSQSRWWGRAAMMREHWDYAVVCVASLLWFLWLSLNMFMDHDEGYYALAGRPFDNGTEQRSGSQPSLRSLPTPLCSNARC